MRAKYVGREVAGKAVWPLVQALLDDGCDSALLPSRRELFTPGFRISWLQLKSVLDLATQRFDRAQLRAIGAAGLRAPHYRRRLKFARALLTLEDAYRFMVYPHEEIDYGCLQAAVAVSPGQVRITAILAEGYPSSSAFFDVMLGAAMALPELFGHTDAKISGHAHSRYLRIQIDLSQRVHWFARVRQRLSNFARLAYCSWNVENVHAELVARTFDLEKALREREHADSQYLRERAEQERRMSNASEVMVEYDQFNRVVYLSPNAERIFGYPNALLIEDPLVILNPGTRVLAERFFSEPSSVPNGIYPVEAQHARGHSMQLEVSLNHFSGAEGEPRWLATIRDVTAFRVPVQTPHLDDAVVVSEPGVPLAEDGPETIMIVDDDDLARRIGARILRRAGYRVVDAANAEGARQLLQQERVDGVVLDLNMPEISGDQLYTALRAEGSEVPVLFVTGDPTSVAERFPEVPLVGKPFRAEQLLRAVERAVA